MIKVVVILAMLRGERRRNKRTGSPRTHRATLARPPCVEGTDLRLVVYSAPAGSPDADALALLGAIGVQAFSASR